LFLDNHIKWCGGIDPNVEKPGFLVFHRTVRYFEILRDLRALQTGWKEHKSFEQFKTFIDGNLTEDMLAKKIEMVEGFLRTAVDQCSKRLVKAAFAETCTSKYAAGLLLGRPLMNQGESAESFKSKIHS